ncbi:nitroreductase family protein [Parabacteroides sp. OttesenSCG-928-G07]|nr:nitroreductase family protein [Parabacteroides sp. OttesenSCG-928-G07]
MTIAIDKKTCIKCGKCVRVCPSSIFKQTTPNDEVKQEHPQSCIECGHCVGVCPTSSITHTVFPAEKVHPINPEELPVPEQVMLLIKSRRSNRAFSKKAIPSEKLDLILEAAHRAPTASNMQQVAFTLVTKPEEIKKILDLTIEIFVELGKLLSNPFIKPIMKPFLPEAYKYLPYLNKLKEEAAKGEDPILRNATALLLIHTPAKSRFGCQDANLAYQNGSLMAESLGISQFYTGFLCMALQFDRKNRIPEYLGIKGKIHAGMGLGIPAFKFLNYIDRKDIQVDKS